MEEIKIGIPEYILKLSDGMQERPMREVEIIIPVYSEKEGLWPIMEENCTIFTRIDPDGSIVIKADKGGLISLARHLLTLAQEEVPQWVHIHYSEWDMLEKGLLS